MGPDSAVMTRGRRGMQVVVSMVKNRLAQPDAMENGWLLDGYPRSGEQAEAIEKASIRPDLFLLINVSLAPAPGPPRVGRPWRPLVTFYCTVSLRDGSGWLPRDP